MLNEFAYCPRLFHIEWIQGEFQESEDTVRGSIVHRRVERESGTLPTADALVPGDRFAARGLLLSAPRLGLIARIDLLEGERGAVRPVDYKKGRPGKHGPWEPEVVQLCAQGLILRENGYRCDEGVLYYAEDRSRHVIVFDDVLVERTLSLVAQLRETAAEPVPPPPLVDSPKCPRCSLVGICLPDETNLLRDQPVEEVRRLVPARDDVGPVYVLEQGVTVGKTGERLTVRKPNGEVEAIRLLDVSHLAVYGNVTITPAAIRGLATRDVPILHLTYGGWLTATTTPVAQRNVELRSRQYRLADSVEASLGIARAIVAAKVRNQRTLLRRNAREFVGSALEELARLAKAAARATSHDLLLGIEGLAARVYFSAFPKMLRDPAQFDFEGRHRRPPPDRVNALLSFLYGLLVKECLTASLAAGLDPYRGLYHRLHYGRPSLALDLAEEFRPIVADSTALSLLNNRQLSEGDFLHRGPSCALTDTGRRKVITTFEDRLSALVRHTTFGYAISYRRVLEVQARLLARRVSGEVPRYRPFTTR
ncbi:MAG TPA: CRISPR-associated endonuclease Cas1 [Candidatus Limnocylindrales bacterium]|nr:CRISPR-associated endonuclease Cas1 [Candidatus Limnocylindrales bacterium]